jgi:hypothetical protein
MVEKEIEGKQKESESETWRQRAMRREGLLLGWI